MIFRVIYNAFKLISFVIIVFVIIILATKFLPLIGNIISKIASLINKLKDSLSGLLGGIL